MVFGLFLRSTWVQSPWNSKAASAGLRKGGVWNLISRPGPGGRLGSHQLDGLGGGLESFNRYPMFPGCFVYFSELCPSIFFSNIFILQKGIFVFFCLLVLNDP